MKKVMLVFLTIMLWASLSVSGNPKVVTVLIGEYEIGNSIPILDLQYKGRTDKVIVFYTSAIGDLYVPITSPKTSTYTFIKGGVTYDAVSSGSSKIKLYRR
jgi:hypothetical protein